MDSLVIRSLMEISKMTDTLEEARAELLTVLRKYGVKCYPAQEKRGIFAFVDDCVFELHFLPGNRRTIVSHGVFIPPARRGKGLGTIFCAFREKMCREAGITLMLATVRNDNIAEEKVLTKNSWTRFTNNQQTGCSLWGKTL